MYILETESSFDAAHFLAGYQGKCGNIHGHRWRVLVQVKGKELNDTPQERGMLMDFGQLKEDLAKVCDYYDHTFIVEQNTLKEKTLDALEEEGFTLRYLNFRPTAENFAEHFYDSMQRMGYDVNQVQVYETPNNCAIYKED